MKKQWLGVALVSAAVLAGCGGGGDKAGDNPFNPNGGGSTPAGPQAAQLSITASSLSVRSGQAEPVDLTALVQSSAGVGLAGVNVAFSVPLDAGAVISGGGASSELGRVTSTLDYSISKANRNIVVTATAGTLTQKITIAVTGTTVSGVPAPSTVQPGGSGTVAFKVLDSENNPVTGAAITVSAANFPSVTDVTDANGQFSYGYAVPASFTGTGIAFTATAAGATVTSSVIVNQPSGPVAVPDAVGTVGQATAEALPSVVAVNSDGSELNSTTVRLKVFDNTASSLPIKNMRVKFRLDPTAIQLGGRFASSTFTVFTDDNGVASTTFYPGTQAGRTRIQACYKPSDFSNTADCPNSSTADLTVKNEAVNVSIGPEALVATENGQYSVQYVVKVVDSAGRAKPNADISARLDLAGYRKGFWERPVGATEWTPVFTMPDTVTYQDVDVSVISYRGCRNEDTNRNNVLTGPKDVDSDGVLEPSAAGASLQILPTANGATKTDNSGSILLKVSYLKNVASWLRVKIYVNAGVAGTEGLGTFTQELRPPITDVKAEGEPAFAQNPYGDGPDCSTHSAP